MDAKTDPLPITTLPVIRRHISGPELPPLTQQLLNAGEAAFRAGAALVAFKKLRRTDEQVEACLAVCRAPCPEWIEAKQRCAQCGCFAAYKAKLATEQCPLGKWPVFDTSAG